MEIGNEEENGREEESPEARTMRLIREEGSRVVPGIRFTSDLPKSHGDNKCLILDLKVWAET